MFIILYLPSARIDSGARALQQITEVLEVKQGVKDTRLDALLKKYHDRKNKIIIFCLYKMEAARVERFLQTKGWKAQAIHGDKSQVKCRMRQLRDQAKSDYFLRASRSRVLSQVIGIIFSS